MIQLIETASDHIPARKVTAPHNILIMLLISIATILISALPGSASASSDVDHVSNFGYAHLLLFGTTSLNGPLR